MRNSGKRQPFLIIFSFTNLEESIPKFSLRRSKYLLKNSIQFLIAFLISSNSKFGVLNAKLNRQINSAHLKNIATLCAISLLFLKSIEFLIFKLVILVEQYRLNPNYRVSCIH
jgi:hypothetical protein